MNSNVLNLLESIKTDNYRGYREYLSEEEIASLTKWYNSYSLDMSADFEQIIDLVYELYIREDIDYRPYEEYNRIVSALANKYHFRNVDFLQLYCQIKEIIFGQ